MSHTRHAQKGTHMQMKVPVVLGVLCAMTAVLLAFASAAWAKPVTIAEVGSGAGQVKAPVSVGVDRASGAVYVGDSFNFRVDEFGANDEFVLAWGFGVLSGVEELQLCTGGTGCRQGLPTGELQAVHQGEIGSFSGEETGGLAVDRSTGDVWISDNRRVQGFGPSGEPLLQIPDSQVGEALSPLSVDGASDLWVGSSEGVQEYSSAGTYMKTVAIAGLGETRALAVTASGADMYVLGSGLAGIREYETASGKQVGPVIDEAGGPVTLVLDDAGNLFVGGEYPYSFKEYSPAGVQVEQFGTDQVLGDPGGRSSFGGGTNGIALSSGAHPSLYSASDQCYQCASQAVQRFPLPEVGKPLPGNERVSGVQPTSVTLEATLDPEDHETTYQFEYGTQPGVYTQSTETKTLPAGFAAESVRVAVTGLLPETTYYFRLTASNSEGTVEGEGASFATPPVVLVESESVLSVTSSSASFEGVLNPQSVGAEWWVEYGTQEGVFDHRIGKEPLASGSEGVSVGVSVQGLEPSTVYHYRFVTSDVREGHAYTTYGQILSFTTQAAAPSFSLPDGRAWEMVTPLNKHNASFTGPSSVGAINEAAASGAGITYTAIGSTEASSPGEPETAQILSRHGSGGWSTRDIASPHEEEWLLIPGALTEFDAFTPDLSSALVEPRGTTLLGGATERTPYLRRQAQCETESVPNMCYLPLVTANDVTSGEKWGGEPSNSTGAVHAVGATPDLGHVLVESERVPLTAEAKSSNTGGLYEWSAGRLELVSVLPGEPGTPVCGGVSEHIRRHVISADGDRVIWSACGEGHLYMREASSHRTVQLDLVQSGGSGANPAGAGLQDASVDGSRVFFSDAQQLTADSQATNGAPDLYVFEANTDSDPRAGVVRDLTVTARNGESANVLGTIPGVSQDGSVVYVVATGVLGEAANGRGETAQSGQPNLYRVERGESSGKVTWTPAFIATLSPEDPDWNLLAELPAGVSANGRWLAFMSERPLTGYDNRDAVSGQRDTEAFLYDAASRRLECMSCDPTGARPHGAISPPYSLLNDGILWNGRWLAGVIPNWDVQSLNVGVYQPRYLSNSGRMFFDSVDSLVPQDVNSASDVYEYEPSGIGSCTNSSAMYSAGQGGCIDLISSGISSEESVFLDASESGNDVFFLTSGKLVSGDTDSAYDVYDAHVCGSDWECPGPSAVSPPCTNTASCRAAPEQQPSVFGAAGSATFAGAENLTPSSRATPKAKPLSRAQKLARALRACRKKHRHKRRAQCERQVRKHYAKRASKGVRRSK